MASIVGVALVAFGRRVGERTVLRYPAPASACCPNGCTADERRELAAAARAVERFNGLSPSVLAKLFMSKAALADGDFEVELDGLRFVTHSVERLADDDDDDDTLTMTVGNIDGAGTGKGSRKRSKRAKRKGHKKKADGKGKGNGACYAKGILQEQQREKVQGQEQEKPEATRQGQGHGQRRRQGQGDSKDEGLRPDVAEGHNDSHGQNQDLSQNMGRGQGSGADTDAGDDGGDGIGEAESSARRSKQRREIVVTPLALFRVIFALRIRTNDAQGQGRAMQLQQVAQMSHAVRGIAARLSACLQHEELRVRYVSRQAALLLRVWEGLEQKHELAWHDMQQHMQQAAAGSVIPAGVQSAPPLQPPRFGKHASERHHFLNVALLSSTLACSLRDVYHAIEMREHLMQGEAVDDYTYALQERPPFGSRNATWITAGIRSRPAGETEKRDTLCTGTDPELAAEEAIPLGKCASDANGTAVGGNDKDTDADNGKDKGPCAGAAFSTNRQDNQDRHQGSDADLGLHAQLQSHQLQQHEKYGHNQCRNSEQKHKHARKQKQKDQRDLESANEQDDDDDSKQIRVRNRKQKQNGQGARQQQNQQPAMGGFGPLSGLTGTMVGGGSSFTVGGGRQALTGPRAPACVLINGWLSVAIATAGWEWECAWLQRRDRDHVAVNPHLDAAATSSCPSFAKKMGEPRQSELTARDTDKGYGPAPIRPYHTLLLRSDVYEAGAELQAIAGAGGTLQLRRLLRAASPLLSFRQLHLEIGIPLSHIMQLAAHMSQWGLGRVVDTITEHTLFGLPVLQSAHYKGSCQSHSRVLPRASGDAKADCPVSLAFRFHFAGRLKALCAARECADVAASHATDAAASWAIAAAKDSTANSNKVAIQGKAKEPLSAAVAATAGATAALCGRNNGTFTSLSDGNGLIFKAAESATHKLMTTSAAVPLPRPPRMRSRSGPKHDFKSMSLSPMQAPDVDSRSVARAMYPQRNSLQSRPSQLKAVSPPSAERPQSDGAPDFAFHFDIEDGSEDEEEFHSRSNTPHCMRSRGNDNYEDRTMAASTRSINYAGQHNSSPIAIPERKPAENLGTISNNQPPSSGPRGRTPPPALHLNLAGTVAAPTSAGMIGAMSRCRSDRIQDATASNVVTPALRQPRLRSVRSELDLRVHFEADGEHKAEAGGQAQSGSFQDTSVLVSSAMIMGTAGEKAESYNGKNISSKKHTSDRAARDKLGAGGSRGSRYGGGGIKQRPDASKRNKPLPGGLFGRLQRGGMAAALELFSAAQHKDAQIWSMEHAHPDTAAKAAAIPADPTTPIPRLMPAGITRLDSVLARGETVGEKQFLLDVAIWLLQHGAIAQMHEYIYIAVPRPHRTERAATANRSDTSTLAHEDRCRRLGLRQHEEAFLHKLTRRMTTTVAEAEGGAGLSVLPLPPELSHINGMSSQQLSSTVQLMWRLCKYFRGQQHVEEIMWRENVSRLEVRRVLQVYKDVFITCVHE